MKIVKAKTANHQRDILYLDCSLFLDDKLQLTLEDLESGKWWVAYSDGLPCGYAGAYEIDNKSVMLSKAGVTPYFRGNGLQQMLIRKRLQSFPKHERFVTYTAGWNLHSANNLIKAGFLMYSPDFEYAGDEVIYWELTTKK